MTEHGCCAPATGDGAEHGERQIASAPRSTRGQVLVPAGSFAMGDHFDEGYPADGETPVHTVELPAFHLNATTVTNAQFATFVKQTDYVTDAEQLGVSAVFHLAFEGAREHVLHQVAEAPWWLAVRGATWRSPEGPDSTIADRQNHPVVHVSWHDAQAYAAWAGQRLPTEAEWERAARGGLDGARFPWGDELTPKGRWRCNIWQGTFPAQNTLDDGYLTTAPAKRFHEGAWGVWQMAGNVWEWCTDWFDPGYYASSPSTSPTGPATGTARVMRGGSYLCHDSYCHRYRVAARSSNTPDSAASNIGFRCANDVAST